MYRAYYPYAKWSFYDNITDHEKSDVLVSFIRGLTESDNLNKWIKSEVWEKETFAVLKRDFKSKYRTRKVLRNDIDKLKSCLYALVDNMLDLQALDIDAGDGWEYPDFKFGIGSMWKVFNSQDLHPLISDLTL